MNYKKYLGFLIIGICFLSCKSVENTKTEIEYRDRVIYRDRFLRDSIYVSDSVFVFQRGDTVFQKEKSIIYKDRVLRDTVAITDTLKLRFTEYKTVTKQVKVKNPVNTFLGLWFIFSLIVALLYFKLKK